MSFPTDRTVIVTGAASPRGIGRATAHHLASLGWNVGVLDLDDSACRALAAELTERYGVKAAGSGADVSSQSAVRAAMDELESGLPPLIALVNIAGVSSPVPYLELELGRAHV